jgi:hypothetical protein
MRRKFRGTSCGNAHISTGGEGRGPDAGRDWRRRSLRAVFGVTFVALGKNCLLVPASVSIVSNFTSIRADNIHDRIKLGSWSHRCSNSPPLRTKGSLTTMTLLCFMGLGRVLLPIELCLGRLCSTVLP